MAVALLVWCNGLLYQLLPTYGWSWEIGDRVCMIRRSQQMVEESWWLLGLQRTAAASSTWQRLVGDIIGDDGACEVGCLSASSWVVVVRGMVVFYRVELSYATVLMFQSNRLLFELSFESSCAVALAGGGAGRYGAQSGRCFFFLI